MKSLYKVIGKYILTLVLSLLFTWGCKKDKTTSEVKKPTPVVSVTTIKNFDSGVVITNSLGKPNNTLIFTGHNFNQNFKETKVLFNDISVTALAGDSTSFTVIVPDNIPAGNVKLTVVSNGQTVVLPTSFVVEAPQPQITGLNITTGTAGSKLVISGKDFSTTLANNKVTINGVEAVIDSVKTSAIYLKAPANPGSGKLILTTHGVTIIYPDDFITLASTYSKVFSTNSYGPFNLCADKAGNLYGTIYNKVIKITPNGTVTDFASIGISADRTYTVLSGCVVDGAGNVYVSAPYDSYPDGRIRFGDNVSKIYKISPAGTVSVFAGGYQGYADGAGKNAQFYMPNHLSIDATGNLYVYDRSYIRKISPAGLVSTLAGNTYETSGKMVDGQGKSARFARVSAMAVYDKTGDIYVLDSDNKSTKLRRITSTGTVSSLTVTPYPGSPAGKLLPSLSNGHLHNEIKMIADSKGALYVPTNSSLYKIESGTITNTYLNPTRDNLISLTFDGSNNLYVSGRENNNTYAVYKLNP